MTTSNKTFTLTFSQAKAVLNDLGRDTLETFVGDINNQPEFLQFMGEIDSVPELIAIYQGGCNSGAYMPATTYHVAKECMLNCSESLEGQIEYLGEFIWNIKDDTFETFCSQVCVSAVESYVGHFEEVIEVLETTEY